MKEPKFNTKVLNLKQNNKPQNPACIAQFRLYILSSLAYKHGW